MHEHFRNAIEEARNFWRPESYDAQIEAFENILQDRGESSAANRAHLFALRVVRHVLQLLFMQSVNDRLGPASPYFHDADLAQCGEVSPRMLDEALELLWCAPAAPRERAPRRTESRYVYQPRYRESAGCNRAKREQTAPAPATPLPVEAAPDEPAPLDPAAKRSAADEPAAIEPALEATAPVDDRRHEPRSNEPPCIENAQEASRREEDPTPRQTRCARREPRRPARQARTAVSRRHQSPVAARQARRAGGRIQATRAQATTDLPPFANSEDVRRGSARGHVGFYAKTGVPVGMVREVAVCGVSKTQFTRGVAWV